MKHAETRSNREECDAVKKMAVKLQAEADKEIYRQRKKIAQPVSEQVLLNR
jgi:hypothetical protein